MLPEVIERFSQDFPRAAVHVLPENIATQQYDNLRQRNVELVLGRLPAAMSEPDLIAQTLFDEPPNGRRRQARQPLGEAAEPDARRPLGRSHGCWRKRAAWRDRCRTKSFRRNAGLEPPAATVLTVSLHLYMRLIETGRWLGLVPASVMRFGGKQMRIKILPIKISSPPAPVGFITVKDRTLTPLAQRFIDCARKIAASDSSRRSR